MNRQFIRLSINNARCMNNAAQPTRLGGHVLCDTETLPTTTCGWQAAPPLRALEGKEGRGRGGGGGEVWSREQMWSGEEWLTVQPHRQRA